MAISSRHGAIHQSPSASAIALTFADWQELLERAQQQGEVVFQQAALGTQTNLPSAIGEGCDRIIQLRGGLTIHIRNAKLRQTIAIEQQHEETFPVTAKFYLSGASRIKTPQVPEIEADYTELAGHSYL